MNRTANAVRTNSSTKVYISDQMSFDSGIGFANREGFKLARLEDVISRYTYDSDFSRALDESKGWVVVKYNSTLKEGNCELLEDGSFKLVRDNAYDKLPDQRKGHLYDNGPGHVIVCCSDVFGESRRLEISTNSGEQARRLPVRFAYVKEDFKTLKAATRR